MGFRTKIDYSDNRQIIQRDATFTNLSGGTIFGVPFSALTNGPNLESSAITMTIPNVVSTFSGNSSITVYTWYDNSMDIATSYFSALTPSNSGITQYSGDIYVPSITANTDGNIVSLAYSGVNFDILPISMIEITPGNYSGTVYTEQVLLLSAGTLDFTGRTIWVDVCGITRTDKLIVIDDATFENIGSEPSAGALHYTANGTLTVNTSDSRLKTNISGINNPLEKIKNLRGVTYNWYNDPNGQKRIGLIAQEVKDVVPELVFINGKQNNQYYGIHYDNITALLIEGIKELILSGYNTTDNIKYINTQTITAEDNNIELNYNGNHLSSIGGGFIIKHGLGDNNDATFILDNSEFKTNTKISAKGYKIPFYTPNTSNDITSEYGDITKDNDYLYIKNNDVWKRIKLEDF